MTTANDYRFVLRDDRLYERAVVCLLRVMRQAKFSSETNFWEVIIRPYKGKRSLDQNSRYWSILQEVSDQTGHTANELHEICKAEFLGLETICVENKDRGWSLEIPKSTTKLNTKEFAEYCDKVSMFAAQEFNVNVEWA